MTDNAKYNGWKNWETWNTRLTYEDTFQNIANENHYRSIDELAEAFESIVSEIEFEMHTLSDLAACVMNQFLTKVDWKEIAEGFVDSE
jgi:hypothetical protein